MDEEQKKRKQYILDELQANGSIIIADDPNSTHPEEYRDMLNELCIHELEIWKDGLEIHATGKTDEFPKGEGCTCDADDLAEGNTCTCIVEIRDRIAEAMYYFGFERRQGVHINANDEFI